MALRQMSFLVADEHQPVRSAVRRVLADLGNRRLVDVVHGDEFLDVVKREEPDVILVDADLPDFDVISTVRFLRRLPHDRARRIGIVLFAAGATPDLVRRARDAGVDEMVCKPFSAQQLRVRLVAAATARREFIIAPNYVGPCRRRFVNPLFDGKERRDNDDLLKPPGQDARVETAQSQMAALRA